MIFSIGSAQACSTSSVSKANTKRHRYFTRYSKRNNEGWIFSSVSKYPNTIPVAVVDSVDLTFNVHVHVLRVPLRYLTPLWDMHCAHFYPYGTGMYAWAVVPVVLGEVFCKIKTLRGLFAMFRSQQTVKFRSKKKACMARPRRPVGFYVAGRAWPW